MARYLLNASTPDGSKKFSSVAHDHAQAMARVAALQSYALAHGIDLWVIVLDTETCEHQSQKLYGSETAASLSTMSRLFDGLDTIASA